MEDNERVEARKSAPESRRGRQESRPVVVLSTQEDTTEIEALVDSIGYELVGVVRQLRPRPDVATFLGRGKLEEARRLQTTRPPLVSPGEPLVVVGREAKPGILFNLEDELGVEAWDRVRLILEIFRRNAFVREARLQVELAQLRYELPFVHEALHRRMTGERPGFMGGGEVEIRTYETHLKRRTKTILAELERVKKERRTRRAGRERSGVRSVAIAGYTNSGKSSLLNELTASHVATEHRAFSTLQTSTRRVRPEYLKNRPGDLLVTDTVGFIRDLPPWLIDAFTSTLEETTYADAVLLVVDASEPVDLVEEKVATAQAILDRIHAPRRKVVLLNKADLLQPGQRQTLLHRLQRSILLPDVPVFFASTRNQEGLEEVVTFLLEEVLESKLAFVVLDRSEPAHLRFESWLRDHAHVLAETDEDATRRLEVRCALPSWGRLVSRARAAGVHLREASRRNEGGPPPAL